MLRDDTDKSWKDYGDNDPYFGVVTNDRFRRENLDERARERFFASGEERVGTCIGEAEGLFPGDLRYGTALDFGCGAGRLTIPLARRFEKVYAVDISTGMLEEARKNCELHGVLNVEFVLFDETFDGVPEKVDFVFSYVVLQHIPARRGLRIIDGLLGQLNDGGIAALDVSINRELSVVRRFASSLKKRFVFLHYAHNLLRRRRWNEPLMQTNRYDLNRIASLLLDHEIGQFHASIERLIKDVPEEKSILYVRKGG